MALNATFSVERLKDGYAVHWDGQPLYRGGRAIAHNLRGVRGRPRCRAVLG